MVASLKSMQAEFLQKRKTKNGITKTIFQRFWLLELFICFAYVFKSQNPSPPTLSLWSLPHLLPTPDKLSPNLN